MEQYYIVLGNVRNGPYDLVTLVKKIRNGTLSRDTLIHAEGNAAPTYAADLPALAEFFAEKKDDRRAAAENITKHTPGLMKGLRGGWNFLQHNTASCILSGIFMMLVVLLLSFVYTVLPDSLHVAGYMICFVLSCFLLSCYLLLILRIIRGQPIDYSYCITKILPVTQSLLLLGLLASIPALIGLFVLMAMNSLAAGHETICAFAGLIIFVIPGLYTLTLYAFAPLLIIDQGYGFRDAMRLSRTAILRHGLSDSSFVYALFLINFFAGASALLPMALTLPVTMSALCEYYEELFS